MLKKLISFVCCLLPIGAVAQVQSVESPDGKEGVVSLSQIEGYIAGGDTVQIVEGAVLNAGTGVALSGGMHIGAASSTNTSNNLYVLNTANDSKGFTINTYGDVSVGTVLNVLDGWVLNVSDSAAVPMGSLIVGDSTVPGTVNIANGAVLNVSNLEEFNVTGSVGGAGELLINKVNNVSLGSVNTTGDVTINNAGDVSMVGLVSSQTTTVQSNGNIEIPGNVPGATSGISNSGSMDLDAGGNINVAGNLENTGAGAPSLAITAGGALTVDGTMKNDATSGDLVMTVGSWTVNGADDNGYSFVNNGDFTATVTGLTKLSGGFNIESMDAGNNFSLTTGTLDLGAHNLISNKLNLFELEVTGGDLTLDTVVNKSGQMNLTASGDFVADYVLAQAGILTVEAGNDVALDGGNLDGVNTSVEAEQGATITLIAANEITAGAGVSNQGTLNMYAPTVSLNSVANTGVANIGALLTGVAPAEAISVTNNVTNAGGGLLNLYAETVSVNGLLTSTGGTTIAKGSNLVFGGVDVDGGVVQMDAPTVVVDGNFEVADGNVDLLDTVAQLRVKDLLSVDKNIVYGGANDALNVGANVSTIMASAITVGGDIDLSTAGYGATLDSDLILVTGDVNVGSGSNMTIEADTNIATTVFNVNGVLSVADGASATIKSYTTALGTMENNGLVKVYGPALTATDGINVAGAVRFDDATTVDNGLALVGTNNSFILQTIGTDADITVGSASVKDTGVLTFLSTGSTTVNGALDNDGAFVVNATADFTVDGAVSNDGILNANAKNISVQNVSNNAGSMVLTAAGNVGAADITNAAVLKIDANDITVADIVHNAGTTDFDALALMADSVAINAGVANFAVADIDVTGDIAVAGALTQNGTSGALNLVGAQTVDADNLTASGAFIAESGDSIYNIKTNISLGDVQVANTAAALFNATDFITQNGITNSGDLTVVANQIQAGAIVNESGFLDLQAPTILGNSLTVNGGNVLFTGDSAVFGGAITSGGVLAQNEAGNIKINADSYVLTAGNIEVADINQTGVLTINSSDINVAGDINASALTIAANPVGNWANINVDGNVSGNVNFVGLEKMTIGGDYLFNGNSAIGAAILPYATGTDINSTDINYWASVSLVEDDTLGQITNPDGAKPLISVAGKFMSDVDIMKLGDINSPNLEGSQVGITVFDMVDAGTAIWLLHADGGVSDLSSKIRNINVKFCNADASMCVAYLNGEWPAYISVRDFDGNGNPDSLYVVFDNRFGGPVEVFRIRPIVERKPGYTDGEYIAAGALDEMVAGQLENNKFFNRTPIEVIPEVFKDTNLSEMANELYNRMEAYVLNRDGAPLTEFSRLFQAHEIEHIAGSIALNEHTAFRSFEDRLVDEFIWNRNRRLDKVWMDVDYGMFYQNTLDGHHTDGHRFSVSGGYDWQENETTILGFTGRVSHTSSGAADSMDLSYGAVSQMGNVNLDVTSTDIGLGAYMMKTLNEKNRFYGNLFLDAHLFDIERTQSFVADIEGNGTAFSLMSEWGLLHDVLNQYIVGNLYARVGYNFGFNVKEESAGDEYMRLKSDGYFILTPGYSLTAQKRIYPSAWFQIRPYASIGIEYDVFGMPDDAQYKFAVAKSYTDYDININPLWANIGGGIELLSANGVHFGVDYRYQYNQDIQLHNIKVSGMYRF